MWGKLKNQHRQARIRSAETRVLDMTHRPSLLADAYISYSYMIYMRLRAGYHRPGLRNILHTRSQLDIRYHPPADFCRVTRTIHPLYRELLLQSDVNDHSIKRLIWRWPKLHLKTKEQKYSNTKNPYPKSAER